MEVTNKFNGLDLINRVPEELWAEVCTLYRRQWPKPSPRKRNEKRQNGCQRRPYIAEKKREVKSKGEKKRYIHLNANFQGIERRDKKASLSDQCKEIEENNRMGKTRDLFKNIKDAKGTFHAKMGSIKDSNDMDLTEAEDIKKKCQNTQMNYTKKIFTTHINMMVWSLT